jgi:RHS repeat-associated protein
MADGGISISLPKGGGALQGIGEKFSPDLHTGTGNFTVPIALPPGRNGFQPDLSLVYSSGSGNGPFGLGWSLNIPGVTVQTSNGIPRYQGGDSYVLSGVEDLVQTVDAQALAPPRAYSWGYGPPVTTGQAVPNLANGLGGVITIAAGGGHTLAMTGAGAVWSWGTNSNGQLGDGSTTDRLAPVQVAGLRGAVSVSAGNVHSLALTADGAVWAWGQNNFGQLGDGTNTDRLTPIQIGDLGGVVAVAAGKEQSFALKADGTVWAWGFNAGGRLGDGSQVTRLRPASVNNLGGVTAIAAGHGHGLALKTDGSVWAWGLGGLGQLGTGSIANSTIAVPVSQSTGLTDVLAIAGGGVHSLALKSDGTVWAWGWNDAQPLGGAADGGQLGDGTTTGRLAPIRVNDLDEVVQIAAGGAHSLALKANGSLWAWGYNAMGQIGDGTTTARHSPVAIGPLDATLAIRAGTWHSVALAGPPAGRGVREAHFRPRTEGLFAPIVHVTGAGQDHWEVTSKSGLRSFYGRDQASRVADRDRPDHVFQWLLSESHDTFGNRIVYTYRPETEADLAGRPYEAGHAHNQRYLSKIQYVEYESGGLQKFLVSVELDYGECDPAGQAGGTWAYRPDPFSSYRAGFEIRTTRRCRRILVKVHEENGPPEGQLVKAFELRFLDELSEQERGGSPLPLNGVSLLHQVRVVGYDGPTQEALPPLEFGYTPFEPGDRRDFFPVTGPDLPSGSLAQPDYALVDLLGNGLPDILELNGTARYWRNLGAGRYDRPREMRDAPAGVGLADPGVQIVDADGDGRADLLVTCPGQTAGYFRLRFDGLWDRRSFQRYAAAPSFDLKDPEVRLVDLTGDGVVDAIRSGTTLECFFNDRAQGWTPQRTRRVERQALERFPNVGFSDPRVKWADISGDGLQDLVLVSDGNVEYWSSLGHGSWGRRIQMRNSPRLPLGYDPRRILLGDVDGDGVADFVYVDDGKVTLWINRGGNSWSEPIVILGTAPVTDVDAVRLADLLGSGISGVLWSSEAGGPWRERMFFLDFTGGGKPYLLNAIDNHLGALSRIAYVPSTHYYLADQQRVATHWKTPLPFPVQVVARVEAIDAISGGQLTSEYRYHHGYWDGTEREFRGFGMVEQLDTEYLKPDDRPGLRLPSTAVAGEPEDRLSPPTLTKRWFHQGVVGDEDGGWAETNFGPEFWPDDRPPLARPAATEALLAGLAPQARRDALRSLRGSILRTELYALDGGSRQARPYTVTESLYGLREEAPPGSAEVDRRRIFFPHLLAERTSQWERGDDPLTRLTFADDYDEHGQPRQQTVVALPRRAARRHPVRGTVVGQVEPDEIRLLATHARTTFARPDPGLELHDRVAQVWTFELAEPPGVPERDPDDLPKVLADHLAAAVAIHQRFRELFDPWTVDQTLPAGLRLIGHSINHYDGVAFFGRAAGEVGPYGALTRSEALAFADAELNAAYGERRPSYLGGGAPPPAGAPPGFGGDLGYRLKANSPPRYYINTRQQQLDLQAPDEADNPTGQRRGLVLSTRDALGHQTRILPDAYWLFPQRVTDPLGLEMTAEYDYRVMQPGKVTDPNGNATSNHYTPLGLLRQTIFQGRDGQGGTPARPEVERSYDFQAYDRTRLDARPQPVSVHTCRRVWHASQAVSDETIESLEYSDGFGRLIQTRAQAEALIFGQGGDDVGLPSTPGSQPEAAVGQFAADRVVVSGWQVYDNKGRVIEKYEPFFASGWAFQREAEARVGQHARLSYDPRGQLIRTVNPDGSEQRVLFGIPTSLDDPTNFSPTPWETYTYDPNDLAPLSQGPDGAPLARAAPDTHHFTPSNTIVDGMGRAICQVVRNGPSPSADWHVTRSRYDLRGNLLEVRDALGRVAFDHAYDLLNRQLLGGSLDGGLRTSVLDATGNLAESRDSKGSMTLHQYDALRRLTHLWARDTADAAVTLRERLVYGDEADRATARQDNLLGRLHQHYDEVGLLQLERYDFTGNLEAKTRRVVRDAAIANGWTADWSAVDAEALLDDTLYETGLRYDALNRAVEIRYPADVAGQRALLTPRYNRAGSLERVELDGVPQVRQLAYNARGQRVLVAYGNGLMTRHTYDPRTFRLARSRTERYAENLPGVNFALAAGGATASASSTYDGDNPPSSVVDGDRSASHFPGYWADDTVDSYPDWVQVDFKGPRTISEIDVFTTQDQVLDGSGPPLEPTPDLTFERYGITDFEVQTWGLEVQTLGRLGWSTVPGGSVLGNKYVWRRFTFPNRTTSRIRVLVHNAVGGRSRIVELEAYESATGLNVALAANGGAASASSTARPWPPRQAIDGDRVVYHWKGQWPFDYPGWLEVDLGRPTMLGEIDLFLQQDTAAPFVDPTEDLTSRYALTEFEVQHWTGSDWSTIPGGSVVGNNRVWRTFSFPTLTTDRLRVLIHQGPITGDVPAIVELEAYAPAVLSFGPLGLPLQDCTYGYDLAGNVTSIDERTPGCGTTAGPSGRDRLLRQLVYDPLYRLTQADGRACTSIGAPRSADDLARCGGYPPPYVGGPPSPNQDNAPDLTEPCLERYEYDPAGNLLRLRYTADSGSWTRDFGLGGQAPDQWPAAPSNRLTSLAQGGSTERYQYDDNGNLVEQNTDRHYRWDHADRLVGFTIRPSGSPTASFEARYLYGSDGLRVKKWVRIGGSGGESTIYLDGLFEHSPSNSSGPNNHLHVVDGARRIAVLRRGPAHPDDAGPPVQYHLGDHLGSSSVVVDAGGSWVNREEYFPYGETSFGSFARKRYRFSGKERDEASGLYYHGARYFAPWLPRWVSCDPAGMADGLNAYDYARCSPLVLVDPTGRESAAGDQEPKQDASSTKINGAGATATAQTVSATRQSVRAANAPVDVNGNAMSGTMRLYSGPQGQAQACSLDGRTIEGTPFQAAAEAEQATLGGGFQRQPWEEQSGKFVEQGIWHGDAASSHGFDTYSTTTGRDPAVTIQAGTELPTVGRVGPQSGALTIASGASTIYAASQAGDGLLPEIAAASGAVEMVGGVSYAAGAVMVSRAATAPALAELGTPLMELGGALGKVSPVGSAALTLVSADALAQSIVKKDDAGMAMNGLGTLSGALSTGGAVAGSAGAGVAGAGIGLVAAEIWYGSKAFVTALFEDNSSTNPFTALATYSPTF